jgi:ribose transport system substrate-binding protein
MKKLALVLLCVLIASIPVFAGAQGGGGSAGGAVKIGISIPSADHGWTSGLGTWAQSKVKELQAAKPGKYDFRVILAASPAEQVGQVEALQQWGMKILVILPHESAPLTAPVKKVQASGIAVIVVDRGLTDETFGYVNLAGDNPGMGVLSGQWLAKEMKAAGLTNYVAMGGLPVVIDTERMKGFFDEMEKDRSLVNLQGGRKYEFANWQSQKGLELMENFLTQYKKIDAVFCQDADTLTGVLQAIRESRRTDIKIVFGGAGAKAVYDMIKNTDPLVRATALYNPSMIADAIQYAADVADGTKSRDFHTKKAPTKVVIPSALIDKSNVDKYYNPDSPF